MGRPWLLIQGCIHALHYFCVTDRWEEIRNKVTHLFCLFMCAVQPPAYLAWYGIICHCVLLLYAVGGMCSIYCRVLLPVTKSPWWSYVSLLLLLVTSPPSVLSPVAKIVTEGWGCGQELICQVRKPTALCANHNPRHPPHHHHLWSSRNEIQRQGKKKLKDTTVIQQFTAQTNPPQQYTTKTN